MYPRAGAYIISVKQSTYCYFGKAIRAHFGSEEMFGGRLRRRRERIDLSLKSYIGKKISRRKQEE